MKKIKTFLNAIILILVVSSCSSTNKIAALKPEPSQNVAMAYNTTTSFVSMPMEISLQ
jgi:PBP1b-binding outer membrane lipoprotein LpoB